jgi:hypothetical protein
MAEPPGEYTPPPPDGDEAGTDPLYDHLYEDGGAPDDPVSLDLWDIEGIHNMIVSENSDAAAVLADHWYLTASTYNEAGGEVQAAHDSLASWSSPEAKDRFTGLSDEVVTYDEAMPSLVFYLRRHVNPIYDAGELVEAFRTERTVYAIMSDPNYADLAAALPVQTCIVESRPTFDVRLRNMLARDPLPELVLITNQCPAGPPVPRS